MWPNFLYKWIAFADSIWQSIIDQWAFLVRRKPHGRRLPSCRFICVSKKSRKYFSLSLSIHTPHLDADWINPVSFFERTIFQLNRTIRGAMEKKTAVCNCVAMNFRFIVLLFWSLPYGRHRNLRWNALTFLIEQILCAYIEIPERTWNPSKQRLSRIFRKIKLIILTKKTQVRVG